MSSSASDLSLGDARNTGRLATSEFVPQIAEGSVRIVSPASSAEVRPVQSTVEQSIEDVVKPPIVYSQAESSTTTIQIFEGRVLDFGNSGEISVRLKPLMGNFSEHLGEIYLKNVHEQDHDLVQPGAVFYLTLYRQFVHGTIAYGEELRFRRLPSWNKVQLRKVDMAARKIADNMIERPLLP